MATPPPRDDRPTTPRPVMGDHPDLEEVEPNAHRDRPAPHRPDLLSPVVLGGIRALLIVLALLVLRVIQPAIEGTRFGGRRPHRQRDTTRHARGRSSRSTDAP